MPWMARAMISTVIEWARPATTEPAASAAEGDDQHPLLADHVADPAEDGREDRRRQQEGGQHPGHGVLGGVELVLDGRQHRGHERLQQRVGDRPEQQDGEGDPVAGPCRGDGHEGPIVRRRRCRAVPWTRRLILSPSPTDRRPTGVAAGRASRPGTLGAPVRYGAAHGHPGRSSNGPTGPSARPSPPSIRPAPTATGSRGSGIRTPPVVAFVMLNPSTADAHRLDPTVRRCVGFARSWGFGGTRGGQPLRLPGHRPAELLRCPEPVGAGNDRAVLDAATAVRPGGGGLGRRWQPSATGRRGHRPAGGRGVADCVRSGGPERASRAIRSTSGPTSGRRRGRGPTPERGGVLTAASREDTG